MIFSLFAKLCQLAASYFIDRHECAINLLIYLYESYQKSKSMSKYIELSSLFFGDNCAYQNRFTKFAFIYFFLLKGSGNFGNF